MYGQNGKAGILRSGLREVIAKLVTAQRLPSQR